jgi:hypothetical protein
MEDVGIFYGHFGVFFPFWYVVPRKIWQPCFWQWEEITGYKIHLNATAVASK